MRQTIFILNVSNLNQTIFILNANNLNHNHKQAQTMRETSEQPCLAVQAHKSTPGVNLNFKIKNIITQGVNLNFKTGIYNGDVGMLPMRSCFH